MPSLQEEPTTVIVGKSGSETKRQRRGEATLENPKRNCSPTLCFEKCSLEGTSPLPNKYHTGLQRLTAPR